MRDDADADDQGFDPRPELAHEGARRLRRILFSCGNRESRGWLARLLAGHRLGGPARCRHEIGADRRIGFGRCRRSGAGGGFGGRDPVDGAGHGANPASAGAWLERGIRRQVGHDRRTWLGRRRGQLGRHRRLGRRHDEAVAQRRRCRRQRRSVGDRNRPCGQRCAHRRRRAGVAGVLAAEILLDDGETVHHLLDGAVHRLEGILGAAVDRALKLLQGGDVAPDRFGRRAHRAGRAFDQFLLDRLQLVFVLGAQPVDLLQELADAALDAVEPAQAGFRCIELLDQADDPPLEILERVVIGAADLDRFEPVRQLLDDRLEVGGNGDGFRPALVERRGHLGEALVQRQHGGGAGVRPRTVVDLFRERMDIARQPGDVRRRGDLLGKAAQRADRVIELVQPVGDGGLGRDRVGLVREDLDGLGEVRDVGERAHGAEPVAQVAEAALDVGDHGMIAERFAVRLDACAERADLLLERRERALRQRILERIGDLGEILAQRRGNLLGAHRREQLADLRRQHAHLFLDRRPRLLRHQFPERVADLAEVLAQRGGDLGGLGSGRSRSTSCVRLRTWLSIAVTACGGAASAILRPMSPMSLRSRLRCSAGANDRAASIWPESWRSCSSTASIDRFGVACSTVRTRSAARPSKCIDPCRVLICVAMSASCCSMAERAAALLARPSVRGIGGRQHRIAAAARIRRPAHAAGR